jgi:STE24 endopeptidase
MQMLVLAAFVLSLVLTAPQTLRDLVPADWPAAVGVGVYLLGAALLTRLHVRTALRHLDGDERAWARRLRLRALLTTAVPLWLVAGHGTLIALGYGRWVMESLGLAPWPLLGELLVLVPFVGALLIHWAVEYPFHQRFRRAVATHLAAEPVLWSRGQYLAYQCRHHLLFIAAPVSLIVLLQGVLELTLLPALPNSDLGAAVYGGSMAAAALLVFLFAPLLIVRVWRTRRLEDGPLRADLEQMCRRLKLRYRDILVWRTDGVVANAAVLGLVAPVRYVLLSDGMLENLSPRAVRAIFAHEAGHIAFHHILYAFLFTIATAVLCQAGAFAAADVAGWDARTTDLIALATVVVAWGSGFGWVSRRFERQSDVTAAWLAGEGEGDRGDDITHEGAAVFAQALERIALLNGIPPRKRNWRHGSIAHRVAYILWLGSTGRTRRPINRLVRRIKIGVAALIAAAVLAVVLTPTPEDAPPPPNEDPFPSVRRDQP